MPIRTDFISLLTLCLLGNFAHIFVVCWFFFQNQPFWKIISQIPSECQTYWIQIRPKIESGLIWIQTVCKGYKQTTLVGKELNLISDSCSSALATILIAPLFGMVIRLYDFNKWWANFTHMKKYEVTCSSVSATHLKLPGMCIYILINFILN